MKRAKTEYSFGPHLMLQCYGCSREKLSDRSVVLGALDKFPDKIGMTKIMAPCVFRYEGEAASDGGISGVVLISESHITIHTFPEAGRAFIDIFSCKDFDAGFAASYMMEIFEAKDHTAELSNRGFEFMDKSNKTAENKAEGKTKEIFEQPRLFN